MGRNFNMNPGIVVWVAITLMGVFPSAVANASHPVSVTRSQVYVTRERVTARIDVLVEDLFMFHDLKPNDQDFLEPDVIENGIVKHKEFLLTRFVIRGVDGQTLVGRVVDVKRFEIDSEGVPLAELMAHKLTFQLEYELADQAEFLTFSQHFTDGDVAIPAEMNLIVKQENAGAPREVMLKPDDVERMRFSWDNPPLSADASAAEQEAWLTKQKIETMGITSYSSVYSFLYIEDHEIRHEILIPLLTLEESVLISRDEDEFLDLDEQDAARQQIEAYFRTGNPIAIDGVTVKPIVQRCDFFGLDFRDFAQQAKPRQVSIANARVGIILAYSTKTPPTTVEMTWNRFNNYIFTIDMIVYADDKVSKSTLSRLRNNNTFEWQNPGRPPVPALTEVDVVLPQRPTLPFSMLSFVCLMLLVSVVLLIRARPVSFTWLLERCGSTQETTHRDYLIVTVLLLSCAAVSWPYSRREITNTLVAVPQMSDEQAEAVFRSLHVNTFRAFDYHAEEDIYDALAKSVDGELLDDLYLQIRRGLEMQEQGGAVSRIREVKIIDGKKEPLPNHSDNDERGFQFRCRWTVNGTVEHWGHIHARTNEYKAVFAVQPRKNAWKITNVELLDEKRIKFETGLRGL